MDELCHQKENKKTKSHVQKSKENWKTYSRISSLDLPPPEVVRAYLPTEEVVLVLFHHVELVGW